MYYKTLIFTIILILAAGCKKNKPPEIPEKPIGPTSLSKNQIGEYITKAHDPNKDDEIRYIFNWGDGKDDTTNYFANDSTAKAQHAWADTGKYNIKVCAQDQKDALSKDWSESFEVKIVMNSAPNKPLTPLGPSYGLLNVCYTFRTFVVDPDSDSVSVKFNWGDGRTPIWTEFYTSSDTIQDTVTYTTTGIYSIRVLAIDKLDNISEWSDSFKFQARTNTAPNKPLTPFGPNNGYPNILYTFKTIVIDPDSDNIAVKFDWGNGRNPVWTRLYTSGDTIQDTITYSDTGAFSIRVVAKDIFEDTSNWSESQEFIVHGNRSPETPQRPSGPTLIGRNTVIEYSTRSHDPDIGDEIRYFFEWGDGIIDTTDYFFNDSTAYASHAWTDTGHYPIRVRAQDNHGAVSTQWSESLLIRVVINHSPNRPFIIGDPYGRPNRQYTFKTIVTDPDADSVAAKFLWGDGRTPTWSPFYASGDTIKDTITYTEADTYKIRVVAIDKLGSLSDTSNVFNFIVSAGAWSFIPGELGEEFNSSPALITSGNAVTHIIVGCNDGYVYCLDSLGDSVWVYPPEHMYTADAFNASPVIGPDNKIYIGDEEGRFHGINPNGTPIWDPPLLVAIGYYLNSSPAINATGDLIYIGCENETLYAINTWTGSIEWKFAATGGITSSPAIAADGAIVFGDENDSGRLYILNPDGCERHIFYVGGPILSSPAINENKIYFSASETLFYAIDTNGTLLHTFLPYVRDEVFSSPTIGAEGIIYFGDLSGNLYALNPDLTPVTGWPIQITDEITSSVAIGSDNLIYFVGNDDYLYAWSSTGGPTPEWKVKLGRSKSRKQEALKPSPVIGPNGWIYAASQNGVYGFKRNITLANTPWPMFRHDIKHTGRVGGGR